MSEPLHRRHVLEPFLSRVERRARPGYGVVMEVLPYRGYLNLRGDPNDSGFLAAVREVLGQPLPIDANTFTEGECRAFWLGPDEWLVMTEPGRERALAGRLDEALAGSAWALTDLTGGQICIRLSGRNARDVLAKGSTLDFHPGAFLPGQCAQTVLGKASMLIALSRAGADGAISGDAQARRDAGLAEDPEAFDIVLRRTYAEYAAEWLHHSAREYGVKPGGQDSGQTGKR